MTTRTKNKTLFACCCCSCVKETCSTLSVPRVFVFCLFVYLFTHLFRRCWFIDVIVSTGRPSESCYTEGLNVPHSLSTILKFGDAIRWMCWFCFFSFRFLGKYNRRRMWFSGRERFSWGWPPGVCYVDGGWPFSCVCEFFVYKTYAYHKMVNFFLVWWMPILQPNFIFFCFKFFTDEYVCGCVFLVFYIIAVIYACFILLVFRRMSAI